MTDRAAARAGLKSAIVQAAAYLAPYKAGAMPLDEWLRGQPGGPLASPAAKAHPKKEPGQAAKLRAEGKLTAVLESYFGRLAKRATARLKAHPPKKAAKASSADSTFGDDFFDDEEVEPAIIRVLGAATQDGAAQYSAMVDLEIDTGAVNTEAVAAVKKYAFDLVKGLNDTSREALRDAVAEFIQNPGMTIGDVIDQLPFGDARAALIATTEITRAYAQGQQAAGEATAAAWPDVPVTKMWHTNNDDRVCDICDPLDGLAVDQDEDFDDGIDAPPGHPGCRCWVSYRTNINA